MINFYSKYNYIEDFEIESFYGGETILNTLDQ